MTFKFKRKRILLSEKNKRSKAIGYARAAHNEFENLIKENFKDTALRIYELDNEDRKSLLAEYREWIMNDLNFEEVMMLPYEAYTDKLDSNFLDDLL